ncbi:MAG: aminomethyltransferase beta-barrel domain-containing protein, partial [Chthoniobacterales bacterium]
FDGCPSRRSLLNSAGVNASGYNEEIEVTVKIRYNHPGTRATVSPLENDRARIRLHEAQRAVTPGQAAVIYRGDVVLGGGWICRHSAGPERTPAKSKDLVMAR